MSHSKDSKKIKVRLVNRQGEPVGTMSLANARRYVRRGSAEWVGDKMLRMFDAGDSAQAARVGADVREFPLDTHYQDDRAVIKFWGDSRSSRGRAA